MITHKAYASYGCELRVLLHNVYSPWYFLKGSYYNLDNFILTGISRSFEGATVLPSSLILKLIALWSWTRVQNVSVCTEGKIHSNFHIVNIICCHIETVVYVLHILPNRYLRPFWINCVQFGNIHTICYHIGFLMTRLWSIFLRFFFANLNTTESAVSTTEHKFISDL